VVQFVRNWWYSSSEIITKDSNPGDIIRDFKKFTSRQVKKLIEESKQERRREWILWMMEKAGSKNSNVKNRQFWQ